MLTNVLVSKVLEVSKGGASDMTHALNALGNGDMGAGIKTLWNTGEASL